MTNIISSTINQSLVEEVDKIRENYNFKRSKFIAKILKHVVKNENLLQQIFNQE